MEATPRVRGIRDLIDKGYQINKVVKNLNSELDLIKEKIRKHARGTQNSRIEGKEARVVVTSSTACEVDILKAWKLLGSDIKSFKNVIKIVVTNLKSIIGEDEFDKISKKSIAKPFHIINFYPSNGGSCEKNIKIAEDIIEDCRRTLRKMDG